MTKLGPEVIAAVSDLAGLRDPGRDHSVAILNTTAGDLYVVVDHENRPIAVLLRGAAESLINQVLGNQPAPQPRQQPAKPSPTPRPPGDESAWNRPIVYEDDEE